MTTGMSKRVIDAQKIRSEEALIFTAMLKCGVVRQRGIAVRET